MPLADSCLLLDKPEGITSAELVARTRKQQGLARLGHAGTLDRFASGLMLLLSGKATRLCPLFVGLDKRYRARVSLGVETTTLDPEGEVVARGPIPSGLQLRDALRQLVAQSEQLPPDFSALHVGGTRAYQLALQGRETGLRPRPTKLYSAALSDGAGEEVEVSLHCASGYYVRAFARDLGRLCGSYAHVTRLRREAIGPFRLEAAASVTGVEDGLPPLELLRRLDVPMVEARAGWEQWLRDGRMPPLEPVADGTYLLHRGRDTLLAVVERVGNRWRFRANCYPGI